MYFESLICAPACGFVCTGGSIIEEWTVSGGSLSTLVYRYVRNPATKLGAGIGSIIYQLDGSDYRYYHYNHKGDTPALTDADTKMIAFYEYEAWGAPVTLWTAAGVENDFCFSTKQWDATPAGPPDAGLIYFGARYLDPSMGRREIWGHHTCFLIWVAGCVRFQSWRDWHGWWHLGLRITSCCTRCHTARQPPAADFLLHGRL